MARWSMKLCLARMSIRLFHMLGHWMAEWSTALAMATATTIAAESRKQRINQMMGTTRKMLRLGVLCSGLCVAMGLLSVAFNLLNIKKAKAFTFCFFAS